jgi:hypothetical protein
MISIPVMFIRTTLKYVWFLDLAVFLKIDLISSDCRNASSGRIKELLHVIVCQTNKVSNKLQEVTPKMLTEAQDRRTARGACTPPFSRI